MFRHMDEDPPSGQNQPHLPGLTTLLKNSPLRIVRAHKVMSQFEILSAVRWARRAIKQERTSTESGHRRLNRWPPGEAAAGGRRRMACHHQTRRGGDRADTHR